MSAARPWVALLGWFPPIYVVGLFANANKPWIHTSGWISGNTPIFWWPTRLYKYRKWLANKSDVHRG